jgi:hypothetical protein
MPYHNSNADGIFFFDQISGKAYLNLLTAKIKAAYPTAEYKDFLVSTAYSITWLFNANSKSTLVQVVLCTNIKQKTSFMIVSYKKLDLASDINPSFYVDTMKRKINFHASLTGSNCGVPGQFIFQLNVFEKSVYFLLYYYISYF